MMVSEEQFTGIVNETKGIVLAAVRSHLFEHYAHAIDDVVQETYLRAYKSLLKDKFQNKSKLSTWLYAIARNESLRMNGKLKNEETKRERFTLFSKDISVPEKEAEHGYIFTEVMKKIGELPMKYRTIIMLHYEGVNETEIAAKLLIPRGTVKSRLHRGRRMIYALMNKGGKNNEQA